MVVVRSHGGGCCGVRHAQGFTGIVNDAHFDDVLRLYSVSKGGQSQGKLIEAIITDGQFKANPRLAQQLKDRGFRPVTRFHNSTGGLCNVFHRVGGERDLSQCRQPWMRIFRNN